MKPQDSPPEDPAVARAWLSALADGQADACGPALQAWAIDPDARRTWHAYQLVGDVLRSDDLATPADHDEAFLLALRQRLAREPVILAPATAPPTAEVAAKQPPRVALRWGAAAAVAGFLMVGGAVLMVQRMPTEISLASFGTGSAGTAAPMVVSSVPAQTPGERLVTVPPGLQATAAAADSETPQWRTLNGQVRRDARLETYLRAHRVNSVAAGRLETVVLER